MNKQALDMDMWYRGLRVFIQALITLNWKSVNYKVITRISVKRHTFTYLVIQYSYLRVIFNKQWYLAEKELLHWWTITVVII